MRWLKGISPDTALYGLLGANILGYVLWQTHPHVMEQVRLRQILHSFPCTLAQLGRSLHSHYHYLTCCAAILQH